jgi:hypothetical protein
LNCGSSLNNGYKFCPTCGQKANTHRLNLHEIGHDALHYVTHADKGIFHLLRELIIRPGLVAREYIAGKRVKYFKPVNFFLIVGGFLVFMTTHVHLTNETLIKRIEQAAAHAKDPVKQKELYGLAKRTKTGTEFIAKYANVVNMLLMPFFAFILWLFYRKAGYSYIEHVVANLYFMSFATLCYALLVVPWQKQLSLSTTSWIMLVIVFVTHVLYMSFAYYQFINKKGAGQFFKAMVIIFSILFVWSGIISWLLSRYILTGFR